jgi:hypothetical protein
MPENTKNREILVNQWPIVGVAKNHRKGMRPQSDWSNRSVSISTVTAGAHVGALGAAVEGLIRSRETVGLDPLSQRGVLMARHQIGQAA